MTPARRTIAIVTGSRAEFGLLRPVIEACRAHPRLTTRLVVAGSHLLPPALTVREARAHFTIDALVPMQRPREARTRAHDALALARGIDGFARAFSKLRPSWAIVLGDRVEAFAAAAAASVAGIGLCHLHGGDRAEGIADEAMRHAITKLAHLHCAATATSAQRIVRMGEDPACVHTTGSPAIDGLNRIAPMGDDEARTLGDPRTIVLYHPAGLTPSAERRTIAAILRAVEVHDQRRRAGTLCLAPNADAGRDDIDAALRRWCGPAKPRRANPAPRIYADHLPRPRFLALLKRLATPQHAGLLIGNSSAGLIEAQAIGGRLAVVNVGPRQNGRERTASLADVPTGELPSLRRRTDDALRTAAARRTAPPHPFGDGHAGLRIAALLAKTDPAPLLRKRCTY